MKMATKSESNIAKDDFERCGFYVQRKRRYCRMIPAKGNIYCAEHLCHQQNSAIGSFSTCSQDTKDATNVSILFHLLDFSVDHFDGVWLFF